MAVRDQDRVELERRARSKAEPARVAQRARIVLLSAQGLSGPAVAERVGCTEPTVITWRRRYAERGLAGLEDAPRPGGPVRVMTPEVAAQLLADTVTPQGVIAVKSRVLKCGCARWWVRKYARHAIL